MRGFLPASSAMADLGCFSGAMSIAPRQSVAKTVRNETAASSVTGGRALALVRVAGGMLASLRETADREDFFPDQHHFFRIFHC